MQDIDKYILSILSVSLLPTEEPDSPTISDLDTSRGTAVNNSCVLRVNWKPPLSESCPIKAYTVYFREVFPNGTKELWRWELVNHSKLHRHEMHLKCRSKYQVAVTAHNAKGESQKSQYMVVTTAMKGKICFIIINILKTWLNEKRQTTKKTFII